MLCFLLFPSSHFIRHQKALKAPIRRAHPCPHPYYSSFCVLHNQVKKIRIIKKRGGFFRTLLQSVEQLSSALQQFVRVCCVGGRAGGCTCWRPHDKTSETQALFPRLSSLCVFFFLVPSSSSDSVAAGWL